MADDEEFSFLENTEPGSEHLFYLMDQSGNIVAEPEEVFRVFRSERDDNVNLGYHVWLKHGVRLSSRRIGGKGKPWRNNPSKGDARSAFSLLSGMIWMDCIQGY